MAIFIVSSLHLSPKSHTFGQYDKFIHFIEYGIFGWLWFRAFSFKKVGSPWIRALLSVGVIIFLGGMDEWYQMLNPTRTSDVMDLGADIMGSIFAIGLLSLKEKFGR